MIDILMATYNGGQYIERQLLSLIGQTYKNWELIIHDDGSDDETLEVIYKYSRFDNRITLLNDGIRFGDAGKNFMHILKYSTADYIIFCDQDDIWLENKLEVLALEMEKLDIKSLNGVFASGYLYSEDKGVYGKIPSLKPKHIKEALFLNGGLQGCSLLFNKHCREYMLLYNSESISMHDHLLTMTLLNFGQIKYLNQYLMLYRQNHINKVTSNIETNKLVRIKNQIISKNRILDERHYRLNLNFYHQFRNKLSSDSIKYYNEFFKIINCNSKFKSILLIINNGFKIGNSSLKLIFKILLRPLI